jgi:hypothetical protein
MRIHSTIWEAVQQWIWPTWKPTEVQYYLTEYNRPEPMPTMETVHDRHTQFVGYNPDGNLVKATPLPFVDATSTDFATIRAYAKGKAVQANVEANLTEQDRAELGKRKPAVPEATAAKLKEIFADKGGATTAEELATVSGYSKSYCAAALAAFRAALPRE